MATVTYIPEKTQNESVMKAVINYCKQDKKTLYTNEKSITYNLVSGVNCVGECAYEEFMATKKSFKKDTGTYFYHYVQSFKPFEEATPDEIHRMGKELADKYFKGYEVLICTHIDADHWHNHLVINSVSFENGRKLQQNPRSIEKIRAVSDEICTEHGLEILKAYKRDYEKRGMRTGEYRAALRGHSWKYRLIADIDSAMLEANNFAEFQKLMEDSGYHMRVGKYITYATPTGKKSKDSSLHDEKYLLANMQKYFDEKQAENAEFNLLGFLDDSELQAFLYEMAQLENTPDNDILTSDKLPSELSERAMREWYLINKDKGHER